MSDDQWEHGMDGWRVRIANPESALYGIQGEVTGFVRHRALVWVVLDGRDEPLPFGWGEVRPA